MKQRIQKALAMLVALVMVLSTSAVVFADGPLITPALDCPDGYALTIHHRVQRVGEVQPGDPTGSPLPSPVGLPVEGSTWRFYRVASDASFLYPASGAAALAYAAIGTADVTFVEEGVTAANGQVTFETSDRGIFLAVNTAIDVVLNPNLDTDELHPPFLVTLPFLWGGHCECPEDATECDCDLEYEWLCHVHAYTKTPYDDLEFIKGDDGFEFVPAEDCDCTEPCDCMDLILNWYFGVEIIADMDDLRPVDCDCDINDVCVGTHEDIIIRITDRLDPRLSYIEDTSVVFVYVAGNREYMPAGYFTVTVEDYAGPPEQEIVRFLISQAGAEWIYANGEVGERFYVVFSTLATIEDEDDLGTIYNDGELEFGNDRDAEIGENDRPSVTTYAIEILKVNVVDETDLLEGAIFRLYHPDDIEDGIPVSGAIPVAVFAATDANGLARIYGIPAGTWYLYEYAAPEGFRRITRAIQITLGEDVADDDYIVEIIFPNERGFDLPMTGGAGTIMFTIGGLVLIGGAVALLMFAPKKKEKKVQSVA